jgi:hypothetical protein
VHDRPQPYVPFNNLPHGDADRFHRLLWPYFVKRQTDPLIS